MESWRDSVWMHGLRKASVIKKRSKSKLLKAASEVIIGQPWLVSLGTLEDGVPANRAWAHR
jgi:hypothetical protein